MREIIRFGGARSQTFKVRYRIRSVFPDQVRAGKKRSFLCVLCIQYTVNFSVFLCVLRFSVVKF
jgi:hypothetical protein